MEDPSTDPPVIYQRISAIVVTLAVALGAYGAHGLEASDKGLANWKTAVLYHLVHGVVLYFLSSRVPSTVKRCCPNGPWWCLLVGILVFSGLLYTIVLTDIKWLGAIVPIGGLSFMVGWIWLAVAPHRSSR